MNHIITGILGSLLLLSPAHASVLDITLTGTVSDGVDASGVFGARDVSLATDAYVLHFSFDTGMGKLTDDGTTTTLAGGPGFGPLAYNPFASPGTATLTIKGISAAFTVDTSTYSNGFSEAIYSGSLFSQLTVNNIFNSPDHLTENIIDPNGFRLFSHTWADGNAFGTWQPDFVQAYGSLSPGLMTVTVSDPLSAVPSVPEPATWVMMILGFLAITGLTKLQSRRRLFGF